MSKWTILCPGPSLRYLINHEYNIEKTIAVNSAILLPTLRAKYLAMIDCDSLLGYSGLLNLKQIADTLILWLPQRWVDHMTTGSAGEYLKKLFACFKYESYPGIDLKNVMPFGNDIEWRLSAMTTALALAILKGASEIVLVGCDLCGNGYYYGENCDNKPHEFDARWRIERKVLSEITRVCKHNGIKVRREWGRYATR